MARLLLVSMLFGPSSVTAAQVEPPAAEACRGTEVTVATSTPRVKAGTRPQFSVVVINKSKRSTRVLDVRNGRRTDLQDVYFELFIVRGGRVIDLPIVISDPGPISNDDYVTLKPGQRMEVRPLSYKRVAERLPPSEYSAFILFWRDPEETYTSRCRSSDVRFVVSK